MNKRKKSYFWFGATSLFLVLFCFIFYFMNQPISWYGYVVGQDRKIYMVNLDSGELEWTSRSLKEIGEFHPDLYVTEIDINREKGILYVAIESGIFRQDFIPLIAVELSNSADVIFHLPMNHNSGLVNSANKLRLNPNGQALYVDFFGSDPSTTILDPLSGQIIGGLKGSILKREVFSPDGGTVATIRPRGYRLRDSGLEEYQGYVLTFDLDSEEGAVSFLSSGRGLFPPWGASEEHFVYVRFQPRQNIYRLEVYDRESGKILAKYDKFSDAVKSFPNQQHPTHIPGTDLVAMTAGNEVIVFNGKTAEVVNRIHVADVRLTEVVVSDQPLIRTDNR